LINGHLLFELLVRYFPEIVAMLNSPSAERFVLDSELLIAANGELSTRQEAQH